MERENMDAFPDAIYAAYLTGKAGSTFALLVFRDGVIAGTDVGAVHYDGTYELTSDRRNIVGNIEVSSPAGTTSITGVSNPDQPLTYDVPFRLPVKLDPDAVYRIETPIGPVNAKFKKERVI